MPANVAGADGYTVRLWVTLKDSEPQMVQEVPVGPTSVLVIQEVELEKGRNSMQASIMGPGGESELSAVADWILDQSRPSIKISSPKDNASTSNQGKPSQRRISGIKSVVGLCEALSTRIGCVATEADAFMSSPS